MERIELHPIFTRYAVYNDHYEGELSALGDALGRDCMIASFLPERLDWARLYVNDGDRNEDWFSWNAQVLSPLSGRIVEVYENPAVNRPGRMNPSRASSILIEADDGTVVTLAHTQSACVKEGERVAEGQLVAFVGNNGYARNPHIHIGAHKDGVALAVGFDAKKVSAVRDAVGEYFWLSGLGEAGFCRRAKGAQA